MIFIEGFEIRVFFLLKFTHFSSIETLIGVWDKTSDRTSWFLSEKRRIFVPRFFYENFCKIHRLKIHLWHWNSPKSSKKNVSFGEIDFAQRLWKKLRGFARLAVFFFPCNGAAGTYKCGMPRKDTSAGEKIHEVSE